jgi:hypothetical protein
MQRQNTMEAALLIKDLKRFEKKIVGIDLPAIFASRFLRYKGHILSFIQNRNIEFLLR